MAASPDSGWTVRVAASLAEVDRTDWQRCAGATAEAPPPNPFVDHDFLAALEDSGSATGDTGWQPQHLLLEDADGALLGCMPVYLKDHSYGEYVFDWAWADAFHRAGGRYYPKLVSAVPFAPVTGPRALVPPDAPDATDRTAALFAALAELATRLGVSSVHVNFCTQAEWDLAPDYGFLQRLGQQYHWQNDGYDSFDGFLETLSSRKRKTIRRERKEAQSHGLTLRALTGDDIRPEHWDAFYRFYRNTSDRKWGEAYLTRDFFNRIGQSMPGRVALMMGFDGATPVCGALNLIGADTLYGRNWGAAVHLPFLHFEVCYYMAIDFAIERGLQTVEAGAQGEHKIFRGYVPTPTRSVHWIGHESFRDAVARFLMQERTATEDAIAELARYTPFRKNTRAE